MSFDISINRVLLSEGGYVNDPQDPGGETNWGICKRSYPHVDIRALTREQAIEIYRTDFWDLVHGDALPGPLGFQALDFAVNSGISTAIRKLQVALGVADDGHWGPITKTAVTKANPYALVMRFLAERADFWRKCSTWSRYGGGWTARLAADMRYAAADFENAV